MPNTIDSLLNELYTLDPTLRDHDQAVRGMIEQLMANKPDIKINEPFIQQLHATLMDQPLVPTKSPFKRWWPALALPFAVAAVVFAYTSPQMTDQINVTHGESSGQVVISNSQANAFGSLTSSNVASSRSSSGMALPSATQTTTKDSSGSEIAVPTPAPDNVYAYPVYSYDGKITIPTGDVLKREKGLAGLPSVVSQSVPLLNIGSFAGLDADQVTWSQRTDDGYTISVDGREGTVSIYRVATTTSPMKTTLDSVPAGSATGAADSSSPSTGSGSAPATGTTTVNAGEVNPTTSAPAISDADAIRLAKLFLQRHGISLSGYGAPIVQTNSGYSIMARNSYPAAPVTSVATVTFPWVVKSLPVYDESGTVFGLQVTVDAQTQTVQTVSNLMTRNFTASSYAVTSSVSAIQNYLQRGGWLWSGVDATTKTVTIKTEAPTSVYMLSRYQLNGQNDDLLVPALRFPLTSADQKTTGRSAVIVPVVDDLLKPVATSDMVKEGTLVAPPAPAVSQ